MLALRPSGNDKILLTARAEVQAGAGYGNIALPTWAAQRHQNTHEPILNAVAGRVAQHCGEEWKK